MEEEKKIDVNEEARKVDEEAKKVKVIKKLQLGEGEIYLGELPAKDRYQVLIRHINLLEQNLNMLAQCASIQAICLEELCKKQGIAIDKIINNK